MQCISFLIILAFLIWTIEYENSQLQFSCAFYQFWLAKPQQAVLECFKPCLQNFKILSQGSIVKFWLGPTMCSPCARLFHHFVLHPSPAHFCQLISSVCQGSWSRINWLRSCSQRVRSGCDGYIIALVGFNCLRMPSYEVLYKEDNVYYRLLDLPCILAVANKGFKYLQYGASINGGQSFMSRFM